MIDVCPQCGSDDREVLEIACIRTPEEHPWHWNENTNFPLEPEPNFPLDSA